MKNKKITKSKNKIKQSIQLENVVKDKTPTKYEQLIKMLNNIGL